MQPIPKSNHNTKTKTKTKNNNKIKVVYTENLTDPFQTNYSFSRFLTLSTLLQMDTANNQGASANIRFRWNYRPDSDLFVIYTAGQRPDSACFSLLQ